MTGKQQFLKTVYPIFQKLTNLFKIHRNILQSNTAAVTNFFDLSVTLTTGKTVSMETFKGKKILIVNTASDCGYTAQYDDLEKLYQQHKNNLIIIAFPANDFKEQEKNDDAAIAEFCKINYGVTFPLAQKSVVINNTNQHAVFKWLTQKDLNGWNSKAPTWNFCKYLVNEQGNLTHFFEAAVNPLGQEITSAIATI